MQQAQGLGPGDAVNTHLLPSVWPSPPPWKEAWWPWVFSCKPWARLQPAHCCLKIGKRPCEALGALPPLLLNSTGGGGSQPGPRLKSTLHERCLHPHPLWCGALGGSGKSRLPSSPAARSAIDFPGLIFVF